MEKGNAKKKLILTIYFLAVLAVCAAGYDGGMNPIKDTYGLSKGMMEPTVFYDFFGMISFAYIKVINGLYLYLGEKIAVITGVHIVCTYVSFLLFYYALKRFYKPFLTYVVPFLVVALPFLLSQTIWYDAFVLLMLLVSLLFFLIIRVIFAIAHLDYNPNHESIMTETLSERELRESRKPKTIVNDKGETIQLLANPLPGPKKHIKRTMDFDYEVPVEKMYYDIDDDSVKDYN